MIVCDKCGGMLIDRVSYIGNKLVEEYNNVYGTSCPHCGHIIKPIEVPSFLTKKELEIEILKEEMRDRLREKFKRRK
jgi:hypothetical protein